MSHFFFSPLYINYLLFTYMVPIYKAQTLLSSKLHCHHWLKDKVVNRINGNRWLRQIFSRFNIVYFVSVRKKEVSRLNENNRLNYVRVGRKSSLADQDTFIVCNQMRFIRGLVEKFINWPKYFHCTWSNEVYFST